MGDIPHRKFFPKPVEHGLAVTRPGALRLGKEVIEDAGVLHAAAVRRAIEQGDAFDIVHLEYSGLAVAWRDALALLTRPKIVVSCRGLSAGKKEEPEIRRSLFLPDKGQPLPDGGEGG